MTIDAARTWLITGSLALTGLFFGFFVLAPALGYPLTWEESFRLFEIVVPVFLGYLGSATHFIFRTRHARPKIHIEAPIQHIALLVCGPLILFGVLSIVLLISFGYSNRPSAPAGEGMSVDVLALAISSAMGLLAVTTNVIVAYLFSVAERK